MDNEILQTLQYYNGIAKGYAELYHTEQIKKINCIPKKLNLKGLILDLGSGDGIANQFLKESTVVSCDLSFELLKLNKNSTKIQANALRLPFKNNSFEAIFSLSVLQDIPDLKTVINEISRILKSQGTIIISIVKRNQEKNSRFENLIKTKFKITEIIEEEKDKLYIGKKK